MKQREMEEKHFREAERLQQEAIQKQYGINQNNQSGFNNQPSNNNQSGIPSMNWTPIDPNNPAHQAFRK